MMRKIKILSILMLMAVTSFGQAKQGEDKLYYDEGGNLFTGTIIEYYPDSSVHLIMQLNQGKPDGITSIYNENGQIEESRSFKNGLMHGKWEKWSRNKIKIAEANYTDNIKDGKWCIWDEKGTLRYDMTYKNGVKSGIWRMYDDKGKLSDQRKY
jgi:antitoxin component YwqK of YwqJK toxin-antitoxin module